MLAATVRHHLAEDRLGEQPFLLGEVTELGCQYGIGVATGVPKRNGLDRSPIVSPLSVLGERVSKKIPAEERIVGCLVDRPLRACLLYTSPSPRDA